MNVALPGLEADAAILEGLHPVQPAVRKTIYRQVTKAALADRILGYGSRLEWAPDGSLGIHEENPSEDVGPGEAMASRIAALLLLSADDSNHAAGYFDHRKAAGTFPGETTLCKFSVRLDPTWMETMRRRTRKTALERFQAMRTQLKSSSLAAWISYVKKDRRNRYGDKFLTLTMNKISGADSFSEVQRFNLAVRTLFKGEWWRSLVTAPAGRLPDVFGGIKAVEDALSDEGPHVHGHFMLISRFLDQSRFHKEWTAAVRKATRQAMGINLPQSFQVAIPNIKEVYKRNKTGSDHVIEWEKALDEVCKYLTKPADLLEPHMNRAGRLVQPPRADVLLALALVERWPRMFELFGACRKPGAKRQPSLDTSCISVRTPAPKLPEHWEEGAIEPEERVDFRLKCAEWASLGIKMKRERPPSWRELMKTLPLQEWLQVIAARFKGGIRFRTNFLRSYNPHLDIWTMDGNHIVSDVWPDPC